MELNTTFSEQEILLLIRKGDVLAFNWLYKVKYPIIKKLVLKKGGGKEEVKDIFQETLIVFYKNCQKNDFELTSSISTYLYAIANNLWLKEISKKKKKQENRKEIVGFYEKKVLALSNNSEDKKQEQRFVVMEKIIRELKNPCKSLLINFYFKKKSMKIIAEEMGYKNATAAKRQKYKCMERVRKLAMLEMNKLPISNKKNVPQQQPG